MEPPSKCQRVAVELLQTEELSCLSLGEPVHATGARSSSHGRASEAFGTEELRGDRDFVMEAVSHSPSLALQYATEELRGDRELVMKAVSNGHGAALRFATEKLRGDREIVMLAVSNSRGIAFQYATEELKADREFVLKLVSNSCGLALRYASQKLKGDREVVITAVSSSHGRAFQFATAELRTDRDIVMEAVAISHGAAFEHAADELQGDPEFVIRAVLENAAPPRWLQEKDPLVRRVANEVRLRGKDALCLKVALLSGRDCLVIRHVCESLIDVLQECSRWLQLDPVQTKKSGKLVTASDATILTTLRQLQPRRVHELTLVLS